MQWKCISTMGPEDFILFLCIGSIFFGKCLMQIEPCLGDVFNLISTTSVLNQVNDLSPKHKDTNCLNCITQCAVGFFNETKNTMKSGNLSG